MPAPDPNDVPNIAATRLAPSPTGALHLGNARTFLVNWALARQRGWRVLLRVEDLDTPRVKPDAIGQTVRTLEWLGLDWDERTPEQSADLTPYRDAMHALARAGRAYPCARTRREVAAVSAPHEGEAETRFPPELRPTPIDPRAFDEPDSNWRLVVDPGAIEIADRFAGRVRLDPATSVGDFLVWTRRACPSYQLAVVVDDARQGVTEVVRGNDLLDSAARQTLLYRALGLGSPPTYTHLPLVRGPDGKRLAKRHGDTRLTTYSRRGTRPERVVGLCAYWCGITETRTEMPARAFLERFDLRNMPTEDVICSPEDDAWLAGNT